MTLLPLGPVAAIVAGAVMILVLELFPVFEAGRLKTWVALVAAVASAGLTVSLWSVPPWHGMGIGESGRWLVEFSRMYRVDHATLGLYLAIAVFTALTVVFLDMGYRRSDVRGEVLALTLFIASGMMILVSAESLVMVFLGLELLSVPLYVVVSSFTHDRHACEASLKYFLFGALGSVLLLLGIALVYAQTGSLSFPVIQARIPQILQAPDGNPALLFGSMALITVALAFKLGIAPFHMWLPDTYQGAPSAVTGFMGSAVKLAGFGLALRIFWEMYLPLADHWRGLLTLLAVITMFVGNLGALVQDNLKRMFAYSSIAHAGFLLLGLAALPKGGNPGAIYYYLVVYGLMFVGFFALLALLEQQSRSLEIYQLSGMGFSHPVTGLALAVFALSGAGIPPTAGFLAKYFVFADAIAGGRTLAVVLALVTSLVGAFYYLRVVVYLYMREAKAPVAVPARAYPVAYACALACAVALVFFTIFPSPLGIMAIR